MRQHIRFDFICTHLDLRSQRGSIFVSVASSIVVAANESDELEYFVNGESIIALCRLHSIVEYTLRCHTQQTCICETRKFHNCITCHPLPGPMEYVSLDVSRCVLLHGMYSSRM